jgi:hypothetical protein
MKDSKRNTKVGCFDVEREYWGDSGMSINIMPDTSKCDGYCLGACYVEHDDRYSLNITLWYNRDRFELVTDKVYNGDTSETGFNSFSFIVSKMAENIPLYHGLHMWERAELFKQITSLYEL